MSEKRSSPQKGFRLCRLVSIRRKKTTKNCNCEEQNLLLQVESQSQCRRLVSQQSKSLNCFKVGNRSLSGMSEIKYLELQGNLDLVHPRIVPENITVNRMTRRQAICEELERKIFGYKGQSLRDVRKYLAVNCALREMRLI